MEIISRISRVSMRQPYLLTEDTNSVSFHYEQ